MELQRDVGRGTNLVTEGRDQGTTVFPDAGCKFFLTASSEERARRRQRELEEKGDFISLEELLEQQEIRDRRDATRACSPLHPAADARHVDTTEMTLSDVASYLEQLVQQACPASISLRKRSESSAETEASSCPLPRDMTRAVH